MLRHLSAFLTVVLLAAPASARADTLYVAAPTAVGPGHPLRLGPDHRAMQTGDLLHVQFNFSVTSTSSDVVNNSKQFNVGSSNGQGSSSSSTGIRLLGGLVNIPTSLSGSTGSQSSKTENGGTSFTSDMMATVVNVLPSGAMEIAGDQQMVVNGQNQTLHITGFVRPEDIDSTDTVLSSHIADVQATFNGNFQQKNVGLIRRILNWLF